MKEIYILPKYEEKVSLTDVRDYSSIVAKSTKGEVGIIRYESRGFCVYWSNGGNSTYNKGNSMYSNKGWKDLIRDLIENGIKFYDLSIE